MHVERYDYRAQFGDDLPAILSDIESCLVTGHYGADRDVARFEEEFGEYLGGAYVAGVNTGTDALLLAMWAMGVGPGDEVILPANTFHASALAVVRAGAQPVLVDADPDTYLIDLDQAEAAVTSRTRVILPVHLYGKAVDMARVRSIAAGCGALVLEDAAQAHGAVDRNGNVAGVVGDAGCFSFHPSKNLAAAGDAGAVVSRDADLIADVKVRRGLGQHTQNDHRLLGMNSKMSALQAIVLRRKLRHLAEGNKRRAILAERYRKMLAPLPLRTQLVDDDETHVYHLFTVRSAERDRLLKHLRDDGIDAVIRYPVPIHRQAAFTEFDWAQGSFPVSEALSQELLCLPLHPALSDEALDYVEQSVRRFYE
jgi:dTDP-4-amino-4,6-dideoxygalactose transaminase